MTNLSGLASTFTTAHDGCFTGGGLVYLDERGGLGGPHKSLPSRLLLRGRGGGPLVGNPSPRRVSGVSIQQSGEVTCCDLLATRRWGSLHGSQCV